MKNWERVIRQSAGRGQSTKTIIRFGKTPVFLAMANIDLSLSHYRAGPC